MPSEKLLTPEEIETICRYLVGFGIEELRITGGEPTVRREFRDITARLARLPVKKLGLTTNGFLLQAHLSFIKDVGCHHINVKIDSRNEDRYNNITRSHGYKKVMRAIYAALELGLNVKINTVLMRGRNDDELEEFIKFSAATGVEVRFLEMMKIGQACASQTDRFIAAAEMIERLRAFTDLQPVAVPRDSTSFNFATSDGARIGFIASESQPFCGNCSRWRLSSDGMLRACLMSEAGVSVRGLSAAEIAARIPAVLKLKPNYRIEAVGQDMNQIGG